MSVRKENNSLIRSLYHLGCNFIEILIDDAIKDGVLTSWKNIPLPA